MNEISTGSE